MPMTKDTRAFVPTAIRAPSIFRSQVLTTLTRVCICSPCYLHPSPTSASMLADAPLPRGSDATLASGVHCPRVPEQSVTSPLCLVGYALSRRVRSMGGTVCFFHQTFISVVIQVTRCAAPWGSLPAFAFGDVVDRTDATDICSITEQPSLSPRSPTRTAIDPPYG